MTTSDDTGAEVAKAINAVLVGLPINDRLAALACSILEFEPSAAGGIAAMSSVAAVLSKYLAPDQRMVVAAHMLNVVREMAPTLPILPITFVSRVRGHRLH
jgi:hypothetical protein